MEEIDLDIQDVLRVIRNRWKIIVGITTTITLLVGIISFFVFKPVYRVNTKVFIGKDATKGATKDENYNSNDIEMYQKLLKTYAELVKTNDLIENAINERTLDVTVSEVASTLAVTPRTDTQILEIGYQNSNNVLAKDVLVAVVDEFIEEAKIIIPNGTVKVIESAKLPQYPASPNNVKNIVLGFFIGLTLGIIISFLIEYMDNTFKTKEQIEKVMEISVIGIIPCEDSNYIKRKDKHIKKNINKNSNNAACEN